MAEFGCTTCWPISFNSGLSVAEIKFYNRGGQMTDAEVRAELERIDPDFFGNFDNTDWDAFFEMAEDHEHFERFAVLYAESQKVLGEIAEKTEGADSNDPPKSLLLLFIEINEIARTAWKGGK